jgi:hypothetical protein
MSGTVLAGSLDFNLAGDLPTYEVQLFTPKFNLKPLPFPEEAAYAKLNQIDDLGPLNLHSRVVVAKDRLSLPHLVIHAGKKQLAEIEVNGSIDNLTTQTGIDLNLNIQGDEIANLKKITNHAIPLQGTYGLSARLTDPAPNNYKLDDLKLTLGANNITGVLDLNLSGKQPGLAADLAAPKFTLQPVTLPALETLARIEAHYAPRAVAMNHTDGLSMEFENWRFNLRSSNTEPLVRLNVESRGDVELMESMTKELLDKIGGSAP